jgi:hypothetical protein
VGGAPAQDGKQHSIVFVGWTTVGRVLRRMVEGRLRGRHGDRTIV